MRIRTAVAGLLGGAALGVLLPAPPASATHCESNSSWRLLDGRIGNFAYDGVRIRSGPFTDCTILGLGYRSHRVQYDCYRTQGVETWTHVYNFATGVSGWVRDDQLTGGGAHVGCG